MRFIVIAAPRSGLVLLPGIDRKHIHRSRLAFQWNEPERLDRDALAERRSRRLVDQNGALRDFGVRLEPSRKIDRVTDARISRALVGAGVSGHHLAGGDADADLDRRLFRSLPIDVE